MNGTVSEDWYVRFIQSPWYVRYPLGIVLYAVGIFAAIQWGDLEKLKGWELLLFGGVACIPGLFIFREAVIVLVVIAVIAWAYDRHANPTYDQQLKKLHNVLDNKNIGDSPDYWLAKINMVGDVDKITLVFGMYDDKAFCEELAQMYMEKYYRERYFCVPAN